MFYLATPSELALSEDADVIMAKAVPFFIIFIVLEAFIGHVVLRRSVYSPDDTMISILMGSIQQNVQLWAKPAMITVYSRLYARYGLHVLEDDSFFTWAFVLLAIDFFYYWFHRWSHELHLGWATHSVHHSGEFMNMATALRQGSFQWVLSFLFYLPLALIVPPGPYMCHSVANLLFQFWFHTPLVGWMGPLEYIVNTPSSHRMHHRPPGNCNYAGVLIVWDKMFGTYVVEDEQRDYYGLAKQYATLDPLWANAEHASRMVRNVDQGKSGALALLKRRVHHPIVFQPWKLFEAVTPPAPASKDTPTRRKLVAQTPLALYAYCGVVFSMYLAFSVALGAAVDDGELARGWTLALAQGAFFAAASCVGQLMTDGRSSKAVQRNALRVAGVAVGCWWMGAPELVLYGAMADAALFVAAYLVSM